MTGPAPQCLLLSAEVVGRSGGVYQRLAVGNAAVGALQKTVEGAIPFRGWVRKLTGAERYSRKVAAAITAGSIRRAFLKGVAAADGCVWKLPAAVEPAASQAR